MKIILSQEIKEKTGLPLVIAINVIKLAKENLEWLNVCYFVKSAIEHIR